MQRLRAVLVGALLLDDEVLAEAAEELLGGEPVEVLDHAVVVDDAELAGGERHGQEVAVLLLARMVGVLRLALGTHARSGGRTVVSVGHIGVRHFRCEQLFQPFIGFRTVDRPKMVSEPVFCHKIVVCFLILHNIFNDSVNFRHGTIGKKYRFQVSIHITGQHHPVLFLSLIHI